MFVNFINWFNSININNIGLVLNFIGTVCLGLSTQFGVGTAWGGILGWINSYWKMLNILGWNLLAIGFILQLIQALK